MLFLFRLLFRSLSIYHPSKPTNSPLTNYQILTYQLLTPYLPTTYSPTYHLLTPLSPPVNHSSPHSINRYTFTRQQTTNNHTRERSNNSFPYTLSLWVAPHKVTIIDLLIFMTTFVGYGQFLATFRTASSQHTATIRCGHSL